MLVRPKYTTAKMKVKIRASITARRRIKRRLFIAVWTTNAIANEEIRKTYTKS
jgi:hypothetical protein